ncbi:MAG: hypothetical protein EKK34_28430 [Mycobacterium sp.]|nr:MAG: hypothetical protein EKK34_28430 [Mycobacterium sp.]
MTSIDAMALQVSDRLSLAKFIGQLAADFVDNQKSWDNRDLYSFFDALSAWLGSADQLYRNTGRVFPEQMTWALVAEMLLAARIYE